VDARGAGHVTAFVEKTACSMIWEKPEEQQEGKFRWAYTIELRRRGGGAGQYQETGETAWPKSGVRTINTPPQKQHSQKTASQRLTMLGEGRVNSSLKGGLNGVSMIIALGLDGVGKGIVRKEQHRTFPGRKTLEKSRKRRHPAGKMGVGFKGRSRGHGVLPRLHSSGRRYKLGRSLKKAKPATVVKTSIPPVDPAGSTQLQGIPPWSFAESFQGGQDT